MLHEIMIYNFSLGFARPQLPSSVGGFRKAWSQRCKLYNLIKMKKLCAKYGCLILQKRNHPITMILKIIENLTALRSTNSSVLSKLVDFTLYKITLYIVHLCADKLSNFNIVLQSH